MRNRIFNIIAEVAGFCGMAGACFFLAAGILGVDAIARPCIIAAAGFGLICAAASALSGEETFSDGDWWDDGEDGGLWAEEEAARGELSADAELEDRYVD